MDRKVTWNKNKSPYTISKYIFLQHEIRVIWRINPLKCLSTYWCVCVRACVCVCETCFDILRILCAGQFTAVIEINLFQ